MVDVQFDDNSGGTPFEQLQLRPNLNQTSSPTMVRWLISAGIAKDEKTAGLILTITFVVAFSASIAIYMWNGGVSRGVLKNSSGYPTAGGPETGGWQAGQ